MGWEICLHTETVIGGLSWPNLGPQYCAEDGGGTWRIAGRQCHPRKIKVEKETWDGAREEVSWVRGSYQEEMKRPRGQVFTVTRV